MQGLAIKPQLATGSQKSLAAPSASGAASGSGRAADAAKTRTTTAAGQPLNAVQVITSPLLAYRNTSYSCASLRSCIF